MTFVSASIMAKKKSSKQKAPPPKEFSSSPFKSLKGLSAFAEQAPQSPAIEVKPAKTEIANQKVSIDQNSFADEMDFLGVKPLAGAVIEEQDIAKNASKEVSSVPDRPRVDSTRVDNDSAAFLDAVGSMEKTFKDEWPEDEPAQQAVPRRMRQVERGQLKPEDELDLHGLSIAVASEKVDFFLQDAIYQGFKTVLIITGKGLHSSDGPVLRQAVEKLLGQQRELVIEWGVAPRRYGGDGALVVFLRGVGSEG
jgi:DNA-nicking Smr family endonuclease